MSLNCILSEQKFDPISVTKSNSISLLLTLLLTYFRDRTLHYILTMLAWNAHLIIPFSVLKMSRSESSGIGWGVSTLFCSPLKPFYQGKMLKMTLPNNCHHWFTSIITHFAHMYKHLRKVSKIIQMSFRCFVNWYKKWKNKQVFFLYKFISDRWVNALYNNVCTPHTVKPETILITRTKSSNNHGNQSL